MLLAVAENFSYPLNPVSNHTTSVIYIASKFSGMIFIPSEKYGNYVNAIIWTKI